VRKKNGVKTGDKLVIKMSRFKMDFSREARGV
jgi:hypothetical protein